MEKQKFGIDNCDKEPIQIPGSVQSHGILIALRQSDYTILQVSENVFDHLGIHANELLHQPLSRLIDPGPVERASNKLGDRSPRLLNPIPLEITTHGKVLQYDGILHRSGRILILELEKHVSPDRKLGEVGSLYESIRELTTRIMVADNIQNVFEITCDEVRKLSGFSRVLIYQFDEDWNGNVIAESNDGNFESLLQHKFPASDIPRQARELYTTNWLRLIPDVYYKPSPLVPVNNPITDRPLDLSNSVLRSVSPVHVEYMKNLGQGASMSISLLKGRKLWGLISCHHRSAVFLKYEARVAAEFIGQIVSSQIAAREDANDNDQRLQLKALYDDLLRKGGSFGDLSASLTQNTSNLLALTDSQGAAIFLGESVLRLGKTPDQQQCEKLKNWLISKGDEVFHTDHLVSKYPQAAEISSIASGILAITISKADPSIIIWFRAELKEGVKWSGNPYDSKVLDEKGFLHPRKSFSTWLENVDNRSKKWKQGEIDIATEFRSALVSMALRTESPAQRLDENASFRSSLANALATSEATKKSREPSPSEVKLNQELQSGRGRSASLLENFSDFAVLFLDVNGVIENWSAGATRLVGFSAKDAVGSTIDLLLSEEEIKKEKPLRMLEFVRHHQRCEEEMWLYRADTTSFWAKVMMSAVRDEQKNLLGFSLVLQDITKDKAAEEELKAMRFAAESANQAKSAFLANMSHEIRTPLGAVLGFADLMSNGDITQKQKEEYYSRLRSNGDQLTTLINDLLDLSKVESGKFEVESIAFDLPTFLLGIRDSLGIKAAEKSISFEIEIVGALPVAIKSDPTRLRQILINLISNAIKFTPNGGQVTLRVGKENFGESSRLTFRVIDNGKGMSEEEMSRLFKPFAQADASTTRKHGGTGLGLFVSKRLARALSGDLSIESSKPGHGSVFLAFIDPGKVSTVKFDSLPQNLPITVKEEVSQKLKGLNVLVVDDSPDNRFLIDLYLTKEGADVVSVNNGREGVDAALAGHFDVVLMDIQMPVLDGNGAMAELKRRGYAMPVIALTAHAMTEEKQNSLAHGFVDYHTKPINKHLLVERLASFLKEKKTVN